MIAPLAALTTGQMAAVGLLGFLALLTVPTLIIALNERRLVRPYLPMPPDPSQASAANPFLPRTEYARAVVQTATQQGFQLLGTYRDGKGKMYQVRYDMLLSPDRKVLAVVGGGTLASIRVTATWLYSFLADGRALVTTDQQAAMESDLSGLSEWVLVTNADFPELLARHEARLAEAIVAVRPCSQDPMADYHAFRAERTQLLVDRGLARFHDEQRNAWSYTLKGAVLYTLRAYFKGFADAGRNAGRGRLPRPGEPGYATSAGGGKRTRFLDQAQYACIFVLVIGGGVLFSRGPAANPAQSAFRLAVLGIGMVGLVVVTILKHVGPGRNDPR